MLDPITAAALATRCYSTVVALVQAGREAHDVMGQIGQWYGAASDVLYADKKVKNVSPFKRIVFSKSVEAEKQVAKEREEAVYRQIEMRENLMFSVGIFLCLGVISGIVILIFS